MKPIVNHPALILSALGLASGTLGTFMLGFGYGEAPNPGVYMILAGIWFGLVVGFGVWNWGSKYWSAAAVALAATWIGWEVAVNLALQLEENWLKATTIPDTISPYVSGFTAGAVGAFLTWTGAAASTPLLRRATTAIIVVSTGAVFGLLLPWTNNYDSPAILLLPWQAAVAAAFGFGLATDKYAQQPQSISPARA